MTTQKLPTKKSFVVFQHLALLVINAGRNNKRLRSEVAAKLKLAASASVPTVPTMATTLPAASLPTAPSIPNMLNFGPPAPINPYASLQSYFYPPQHQIVSSLSSMVPYMIPQSQQQQQTSQHQQQQPQQQTVTYSHRYEIKQIIQALVLHLFHFNLFFQCCQLL